MTDHDPRLDVLLERSDRIHRSAVASTRRDVELVSQPRSAASRRSFLRTLGIGGLAAGGAALAIPVAASGKPSEKDAETVNFAIRVELFAVQAYTMAAEMARKLGLSAAQVEAGKLFASHHDEHARAEQAFLEGIGVEAATTPLKTDKELKQIGLSNAALKQTFASGGVAVLKAATYVEELAAKTYSDFATAGKGTKDRTLADFAWSIAPVEMSHGSYLRAALGLEPSQATFAGEIEPLSL